MADFSGTKEKRVLVDGYMLPEPVEGMLASHIQRAEYEEGVARVTASLNDMGQKHYVSGWDLTDEFKIQGAPTFWLNGRMVCGRIEMER